MNILTNQDPSLQRSLSALAEIRSSDIVGGVPSNILNRARWRVDYGDFETSMSGENEVIIKIAYSSVVVRPKAIMREPRLPSDCFDFKCNCGKEPCEHAVSAWVIMLLAATRQWGDLRALGKRKIEDLAETISFLSVKPPPEAGAGADGNPVIFKSLLFCVDEHILEMIDIPRADVEDVPPAISVNRDHTSLRSQWVERCDYDHRPFNERPAWHNYSGSNSWAGEFCNSHFEIQYLFSDGTILDAHQILYHAYGGKVDRGLLAIPGSASNDLRYFIGQATIRDANWQMTLLHIFRNAFAPKKDGLQIVFVAGRDRTLARRGFNIHDAQFISPDDAMRLDSPASLKVEIECIGEEGRLESGVASANFVWGRQDETGGGIIPFTTFLVHVSKKSVIFHPHAKKFAKMMQLASRYCGDPEYADETDSFLPHDVIDRWFIGHENIGRFVRELRESPALMGIPVAFSPEGLSATCEQTRPILSIGSDGAVRYATSLDSKDMPMTALNPGPFGRRVLEGFRSGLQSFMDRNSYFYHVSDWGSPKRKNDLSLLSHTGIYAMAVMETASAVSRGVERLERAAVINGILSKMAAIIDHSIRKRSGAGYDGRTREDDPPKDLAKLCGDAAIGAVRKILANWLDMFREDVTLYTKFGPISFPSYDRAFFLFLGEMAQRRALETRGASLTKSRTPALMPLWDEGARRGDWEIKAFHGEGPSAIGKAAAISFYEMKKEEIIAAAIRLRQHGCEIFYEGRPCERLNTGNFRAEFILDEDKGEAGGKIDWFELHPKFFLSGVEIDAESVRQMGKTGILEWKGRLYMIEDKKLPSVAYLERFWNRISPGAGKDCNPAGEGGGYLKIPRNQTLELLLLRKQGLPVRGGRGWEDICAFYDSLDSERKPLSIPPSVRAKLKHYQEIGVQWLLDLFRLRLGGILADDMGLGKTLQALAFLDILRTRGEMGKVLIVVPTSLTYNWMAEGARFTPKIEAMIFESRNKSAMEKFIADRPHAAVICTYGLLVEHEEFFRQFDWNIVIYDETQHLKNISAKRTTVSRGLPARFKIGLTGTPLENHLGECYSLLDLMVPGCMGDLGEFSRVFVTPQVIDREALAGLRLKIRPLVLRRHKSEILKELPPKTESEVVLPFEKRQKNIYRDIAISWNEKVRESVARFGEAKSQIMMLTALLRLRQACSDPASLPKVNYTKDPPKVELLTESLKEIIESGESALVFTQFLATFDRIRNRLNAEGMRYFSIHGAVSHAGRKKEIAAFDSCKEGAVFLMTLKTGGVGLNLTKASYVFHIEPWWNPAVENQATDRTHRIGQTRHVQVYRYLMEESIEQKIELLKARKAERFNSLFGQAEGESELAKSSSGLTKKDFDYLLG